MEAQDEIRELRLAVKALRDGYADAMGGLAYILQRYGRLEGVGWQRVEDHFFENVTMPEREGLLAGSHRLAASSRAEERKGPMTKDESLSARLRDYAGTCTGLGPRATLNAAADALDEARVVICELVAATRYARNLIGPDEVVDDSLARARAFLGEA